MDNKNLVFGHKQPDTDSIASAISMANLQTNIGNYSESFRLGKVNRETKIQEPNQENDRKKTKPKQTKK